MVAKASKDAFWAALIECLIEFHHIARNDAMAQVKTLRVALTGPSGRRDTMIYHEEPFTVACRIAREPLEIEQVRPRYEKLLVRTGWSDPVTKDKHHA